MISEFSNGRLNLTEIIAIMIQKLPKKAKRSAIIYYRSTLANLELDYVIIGEEIYRMTTYKSQANL